MADDLPPPGWYEDPWNACQPRWWDGTGWTEGGQPKVLPPEPSPFVTGLVAYRTFMSGNGPRPWWQMRRFVMPGGVFVGLMAVGVTVFLMATDEPPDRLANVDVTPVQVPVSIETDSTASVPSSSTIVITGEPMLGRARSTTTSPSSTTQKATTTTERAATSTPSTTALKVKVSTTTSPAAKPQPKTSQTTTKANGASTTALQTAQSSSTTVASTQPGPSSTQQPPGSSAETAPPTTAAPTTTAAPATTAAPTTAAPTTAATTGQNADPATATP